MSFSQSTTSLAEKKQLLVSACHSVLLAPGSTEFRLPQAANRAAFFIDESQPTAYKILIFF